MISEKCPATRISANGAAEIHLLEVATDQCVHSRFNTRKTRSQDSVDRLAERMQRNGYEPTRAVWAVSAGDQLEVFAGGTRLEAAQKAGIPKIPVLVHQGLTEEQISRLADLDNENDEYHVPVGVLDIWAECHRLNKVEGWTQKRIAEAKGWDDKTVRFRIKYHTSLSASARKATVDGLLDEGHLEAISGLTVDVDGLQSWLTTEASQSELVEEILSRHRGSSQGIKPTVKVVREAAKRWKSLIQAATDAAESLSEGNWCDRFVQLLANSRARTEAAVNQALSQVVTEKRQADENEIARLRAEADEREREAQQLKQAELRLKYVESQTSKLLCGDARELINNAPAGFQLLLTDPPYGVDFQSQRRVTSGRKRKIANDDNEGALSLLSDVLARAHPLMAENATCLIFTGWKHEFEFRQVIKQAGFSIRGSLVFVKKNHGAGNLTGGFAPKHERIIHAVKGNPKLNCRVADVLFGNDKQNSEHPMEKPRDLLRQLIEAVTQPGDTVVDPFFGSGNSLLEAYTLGRDFFGVELETQWHQPAVEEIRKLAEKVVREAGPGEFCWEVDETHPRQIHG